MASGIDFTAMIKGQRQAEQDNWANIREIQNQQKYAIEREDSLAKLFDRRTERDAAAYLSNLQPVLQRMTDSGTSPVDALVQTKNAIVSQAEYQALPAQTQTAVLNKLGEMAALQAQSLMSAGKLAEAQALIAQFGKVSPINELGAAMFTGDVDKSLAALNARNPGGTPWVKSPDGLNVSNGSLTIPVGQFLNAVAGSLGTSGSAAGVYNATAQAEQDARAMAAAGALKTEQQTAVEKAAREAAELDIIRWQMSLPGKPVPDILYERAGRPVPGAAAPATTTAVTPVAPTGVAPVAAPDPVQLAALSPQEANTLLQQQFGELQAQDQSLAAQRARLEAAIGTLPRPTQTPNLRAESMAPGMITTETGPDVQVRSKLLEELNKVVAQQQSTQSALSQLTQQFRQQEVRSKVQGALGALPAFQSAQIDAIVEIGQRPDRAAGYRKTGQAVLNVVLPKLRQQLDAIADKSSPEAVRLATALANLGGVR